VVVLVHVKDPDEAEFPFAGHVRFRAVEGGKTVEADTDTVRAAYLEALRAFISGYQSDMSARGVRFVGVKTSDNPVDVVRTIALAVR
jgi:hypothetical protein